MPGVKPKFATAQDFYNEAVKYMSANDMSKKADMTMKTVWQYLVKLKKFDGSLHKKLLDIWAYKREENLLNVHAFDEINEESAYWLGMLASDGCVANKSSCISLTSKIDDTNHLYAFKDFLKSNNKVIIYETSNQTGKIYKAASFKVSSKIMKDKLGSFGIVSAKSNLDIDYLSYIPEEFQFAFICGYFDGDGSITSNYKHKKVSILGNSLLIEHIKEFLIKKGINSKTYKSSQKYFTDKFEICIVRKTSLESFCEAYLRLSEKYLLERKRKIIVEYLKNIKRNRKHNKRNRKHKRNVCFVCSEELHTKNSARPPKQELEKLIYELPFVQIGKKYGVTDNAVRKWCKYYGLPYRKKDINIERS